MYIEILITSISYREGGGSSTFTCINWEGGLGGGGYFLMTETQEEGG
jgi:hypothetical protein